MALFAVCVAGRDGWVDSSGRFALSASGEQVYAYTGSDASPVFLYAFTTKGGGWDSGATSTTTGCLPRALRENGQAAPLSFAPAVHADNFVYAGTRKGTAASLLASLASDTSWLKSNSPLSGSAIDLRVFKVTTATTTAASTPASTSGPPPPPPPVAKGTRYTHGRCCRCT